MTDNRIVLWITAGLILACIYSVYATLQAGL
jgi:hypothetical protein